MTSDLDQVLGQMSEAGCFSDCVRLLVDWVQRLTGCEAVMLRLHEDDVDADGWLPALVQRGFGCDFLRDEILIGAGECLCGQVCSGRREPRPSFFTEQGSFACDCTDDLLDGPALEAVEHLRGRCLVDGYRSLAIIPLPADGAPIGCLHVADRRPDRFAPWLSLLEEACRQAGPLLARYPASQREPLLIEALEAALTPPDLPEVPGLELSVCFTSATDAAHLGGDFYDAIALPGGDVVLLVGDYSGKGIGAAGMAARARYELARRIDEETALSDVLRQADRALHGVLRHGRFVTVAACRFHPDGRLEVGLAGHPRPLVLAPEGEGREASLPPNMPLGLLLTPAYACGSLQVRVDDTLLLFTDGITESRRDGSLFGTEGICALWRDKPDADVRALTRRLCDASACYHDEGLAQDDRLALAARRRPARSRPRRPA